MAARGAPVPRASDECSSRHLHEAAAGAARGARDEYAGADVARAGGGAAAAGIEMIQCAWRRALRVR